MFHVGDLVQHRKGGVYVITQEPIDFQRLEYCNETYYEYSPWGQENTSFWIRRKTEMEDGRFTKVGDVHNGM